MIKRYDIWTYYGELQEDKRDNGEWVRYDDHAAELATLRAENERLRGKLERIAETPDVDADMCCIVAKEALK